MSNLAIAALSVAALMVSILSLYRATRMNAYQRHEYEFFLREHHQKLGSEPGHWAKFRVWNAALGGPSPKWHWIKPVVSSMDTFQR